MHTFWEIKPEASSPPKIYQHAPCLKPWKGTLNWFFSPISPTLRSEGSPARLRIFIWNCTYIPSCQVRVHNCPLSPLPLLNSTLLLRILQRISIKMFLRHNLKKQLFQRWLRMNRPPLPYTPAAAAKSLQSCPTLCSFIDSSPSGSPVSGILQARTLEWVAISFSNAWKWKVKVKSLSRVWLLATPRTAAYQAPPPMGFSRQEYWSGVPLPSPYLHS